MIAHITGRLLFKQATGAIISAGGVGYEVLIPVTTFYTLAEPGSDVSLHTYMHVREDALQLYGFKTSLERDLFKMLISATGIGPKSAITMLSGLSADEIIAAIRGGDLVRLISIPGIGRKTAERLILDLRDRLGRLPQATSEDEGKPGFISLDSLRKDTLSALLNLEYPKPAAERAIAAAVNEGGDLSFELLLRRSLRILSHG